MRWRDADEEGEEEKAMVYKMSKNSLTASKTIGPLVPGHTYILAACDVESDGSLSDVKLEQLFETKCKCLFSRRLQYPIAEKLFILMYLCGLQSFQTACFVHRLLSHKSIVKVFVKGISTA